LLPLYDPCQTKTSRNPEAFSICPIGNPRRPASAALECGSLLPPALPMQEFHLSRNLLPRPCRGPVILRSAGDSAAGRIPRRRISVARAKKTLPAREGFALRAASRSFVAASLACARGTALLRMTTAPHSRVARRATDGDFQLEYGGEFADSGRAVGRLAGVSSRHLARHPPAFSRGDWFLFRVVHPAGRGRNLAGMAARLAGVAGADSRVIHADDGFVRRQFLSPCPAGTLML